MSTDKRTLRQEVYNCPIDVRILAMNTLRTLTHADTLFLNDFMIDLFSLRARGIIDLKLGSVISGSSTLEVTPYSGPVLIPLPDEENEGENTATGVLYGVQPSTDAYTELWTITFSSTTAFAVSGSFSGSQGSGSTAADFTSTNSSLVIPSDAWEGTFAEDDVYYVPVYKHHPSITMLSTMLATGLIFKGQATGVAPDTNPAGAQLYNDAMDMLDAIAEGSSGLLGINTLIDSSDLMVSYEVSYAGYDVSNYQTDEIQRFVSQSNSSWPWWFNR